MKIQGEINGIKIDIECPEIVHQDGKWWEPVEFRKVQEGEYYWAGGLYESKIGFKTMQAPIYREIPEPSQEWLDNRGMQKSGKPEKVKLYDLVWTQYNGTSECGAYSASNDLAGKYRFKLTPKKKELQDCIITDIINDWVRCYINNEISAGQLLTKLEGMK